MQQRSKGALLLDGLGLTQAAIGARLQVGVSVVGMWRNGTRTPGPKNRKAIFEAFGIPESAWEEPIVGPEIHASAPSNVVPFRPRATPADQAPDDDEADDAPPVAPPPATHAGAQEHYLEGMLADLLRRARTDHHERTAHDQAKLLATASQTLAALRRMRGEASSEANVVKHPKWQAMKRKIADFMERRAPDLLLELADAIEDAERHPT